ncbi:uncharacterized protein PG998_002636 [Apiospora kogelbergensis]|uniref:uncharacterized protein n=1 Tax=Apiospora kogelbergensis TaxID=1337665 RepID=UPI003131DD10
MEQPAFDSTYRYWDDSEGIWVPLSPFSSGSSTDQSGMMDFGVSVPQYFTHIEDWAQPANGGYDGFTAGVAVPNVVDLVPGNSCISQSSTGSPDTTSSAASGSSLAGMKACPFPYCPRQTRYGKDLRRHIVEAHEKPDPGEKKEGWYQCRCKKTACGARKSNHKRHLDTCKSSKWHLNSPFLCHCGKSIWDKDEHIIHIDKCKVGRRSAGRPPKTEQGTMWTQSL